MSGGADNWAGASRKDAGDAKKQARELVDHEGHEVHGDKEKGAAGIYLAGMPLACHGGSGWGV
jgi:hypothetical protein